MLVKEGGSYSLKFTRSLRYYPCLFYTAFIFLPSFSTFFGFFFHLFWLKYLFSGIGQPYTRRSTVLLCLFKYCYLLLLACTIMQAGVNCAHFYVQFACICWIILLEHPLAYFFHVDEE